MSARKNKTALKPYGIVSIDMILSKGMTLQKLKVFIALSSFQGNNEDCWPSLDDISKRCGINRKNVSRFTTELVKDGWIEKIRRGKGKNNTYRCLFSMAPESSDPHDSTRPFDSCDPGDRESCCWGDTDSSHPHDSYIQEQSQEHVQEQSAGPSSTQDPVKEIFAYWNSRPNVKHHVKIDPHLAAIRSALKTYPLKTIKAAIDQYSRVTALPGSLFSYRWELNNFLRRGLYRFADGAPDRDFVKQEFQKKESIDDLMKRAGVRGV